MSKFKVGDKVRIMCKPEGLVLDNYGDGELEGWYDIWVQDMDRCIGMQGKIVSIAEEGEIYDIELRKCDCDWYGSWNFPETVLELVE